MTNSKLPYFCTKHQRKPKKRVKRKSKLKRLYETFSVDRLSYPNRRVVFENWCTYQYTLPLPKLEHLQQILNKAATFKKLRLKKKLKKRRQKCGTTLSSTVLLYSYKFSEILCKSKLKHLNAYQKQFAKCISEKLGRKRSKNLSSVIRNCAVIASCLLEVCDQKESSKSTSDVSSSNQFGPKSDMFEEFPEGGDNFEEFSEGEDSIGPIDENSFVPISENDSGESIKHIRGLIEQILSTDASLEMEENLEDDEVNNGLKTIPEENFQETYDDEESVEESEEPNQAPIVQVFHSTITNLTPKIFKINLNYNTELFELNDLDGTKEENLKTIIPSTESIGKSKILSMTSEPINELTIQQIPKLKQTALMPHAPNKICCASLRAWIEWIKIVADTAKDWHLWITHATANLRCVATVLKGSGDLQRTISPICWLEWQMFIQNFDNDILVWKEYNNLIQKTTNDIIELLNELHLNKVVHCQMCILEGIELKDDLQVEHVILQLADALQTTKYWREWLQTIVLETHSLCGLIEDRSVVENFTQRNRQILTE